MKQKGRGRALRTYLLPIAAAILTTAALTLLAAYLMRCGFISVSWEIPARLTAVAIAAAIAGRISGETGKRGALVGVGLALICAIWRAGANSRTFFTMDLFSEIALCILCSWVGSCIFHKKKTGYTNRNRRKLRVL